MPREPSYKDKPLGYWIDPWNEGGEETSEAIAEALTAMWDRAIPYLLDQLHWKPRLLKLYDRFPGIKFPFIMRYLQGTSHPRSRAAFALGQALEDKDASVRGAATNALKWIDVTAAKKAGVVFE